MTTYRAVITVIYPGTDGVQIGKDITVAAGTKEQFQTAVNEVVESL